MDFFEIYLDFFKEFLEDISLFKIAKKGFYISIDLAELTWHVGPVRMQHST